MEVVEGEGEAEEDEAGDKLDEGRGDDVDTAGEVDEAGEHLDYEERQPVQDEADGGTPDGEGGAPFPGLEMSQSEDVSQDGLDGLEVFVRVEVSAVGGEEGEEES